MFDIKKAKHLAELSKLEFTNSDLEKMTAELSRSIFSAENILSNALSAENELCAVNLSALREDIAEESNLSEEIKKGAEIKNNSFISKRMV